VLTAVSSNQTVAGYTLIERLGAGGYGEVWRATAPGGLFKAVKIVFGTFGDARAERELKSLDRIKELRHPFLLSLERIEIVDGRLVIVSELADMSLKDRYVACRSSGLAGIPRNELLGYMRDAAEALDYMHQRHSLQHLDVKPENMLIVGGRVKVADFGLVKDLHEVSVSVLDGMTPAYAAPELFNGAPSDRSDQYSLAVMYQELLVGERPFTARTAAEWARLHITLPRKPNLDSVPPEDRRALHRALAAMPIDRFASCSELVAALSAGVSERKALAPTVDESNAGGTTQPDTARSCVAPVAPAGSDLESEKTLQVAVPRGGAGQFLEETSSQESSGTGGARPAARPSASDACDSITLSTPQFQPEVRKLPPPEYRPDLWQPAPTLVIGVGGTGCRIAARLRDRLGEKFGPPGAYPAWSTLLIDTDGDELRRLTASGDGAAETCHIPLRTTQEYREESHELLRWLSRRWLYNIPLNGQTQGWRPLGRLAFVDNGKLVLESIRRQLERVLDATSLQQTARYVDREFSSTPRVILVASASSGAGSGSVLDAGYAVRQALRELGVEASQIVGVLTVSSSGDAAAREIALANAYACLSEYHYYLTSPLGYPGDDWCGLEPAEAGVGPFDETYLLHLGLDVRAEPYAERCDLVAEYLFLDIATPLGETLSRCRTEPTNRGSDEPANGDARQGCPHASCLRSFTLLPMSFSETELAKAIVPRMLHELAAHFCGERPALPGTQNLLDLAAGLPDDARHDANERVQNIVGRRLRSEFTRVVGSLVAHAQLANPAAASAIDMALDQLRTTLDEWRQAECLPLEGALFSYDKAYLAVLRATLMEQLETQVPELARRVVLGTIKWATHYLDTSRRVTPSYLDLLKGLTARADALLHEEVARWLGQADAMQWIVPALGDTRHALLCWRNFLKQSEPPPLAVGGERFLALLAPENPANSVIQEMLDQVFTEPAAILPYRSPMVCLLKEARGIPVMEFADWLVGHLDVYKQAAARLHTRIDLGWSDGARSEELVNA
jgi:serine/threonine protein kinase